MAKKSSGISEGKAAAVLSYLLIGIIWYFADEKMKKNSFVKFHVKQGLVLLIFSIIWSIAMGFLGGIFMFGMFYLWNILHLLSYVPLIFGIIGIINALNGKEKELLLIGRFAQKLTF